MPRITPRRAASAGGDDTATAQSMGDVSERRSPAEFAAELVRERRRLKLIRFAACEAAAIVLTILAILAGIATRSADGSTETVFRVLPVTFAVLATAIPILFFGKVRRRRWR